MGYGSYSLAWPSYAPMIPMNMCGPVRRGRLAHIWRKQENFCAPKRPRLYRQAVGAEQESATPLNNRGLHSEKMVEAAGIEPEGTRSKHNAEPTQNRAKPEQNQALTAPVRPAEHQPESTSLHQRRSVYHHPYANPPLTALSTRLSASSISAKV